MIRRVLNSSQPTLASMLLLQNTNSINDLPMTIPVKPFSNCTSVFAADDCYITWCTTCSLPQSVQHVVSLRVESKFVNFNPTLIICLKFVFIEMLDKLITYIMFWYKTMYQILPVSRTNASQLVDIVIRSDTGSHNRLDLIQSLVPTRYVSNGYVYHSTIIVLVHSKSINSQHYRVRVFPSWLVVTVCFLSWAICLPVISNSTTSSQTIDICMWPASNHSLSFWSQSKLFDRLLV